MSKSGAVPAAPMFACDMKSCHRDFMGPCPADCGKAFCEPHLQLHTCKKLSAANSAAKHQRSSIPPTASVSQPQVKPPRATHTTTIPVTVSVTPVPLSVLTPVPLSALTPVTLSVSKVPSHTTTKPVTVSVTPETSKEKKLLSKEKQVDSKPKDGAEAADPPPEVMTLEQLKLMFNIPSFTDKRIADKKITLKEFNNVKELFSTLAYSTVVKQETMSKEQVYIKLTETYKFHVRIFSLAHHLFVEYLLSSNNLYTIHSYRCS